MGGSLQVHHSDDGVDYLVYTRGPDDEEPCKAPLVRLRSARSAVHFGCTARVHRGKQQPAGDFLPGWLYACSRASRLARSR